jgi:LmbE family N-acetylglucosaminyl deacetylase
MKTKNRRLLAVLAHPDDESLGNGGMLAKYAAEGVETYLVTATRGQRGWFGPPEEYPGPEELGRIRESELQAAASVLGIRDVTLLDYLDGELDAAGPEVARSRIVEAVRRVRPDVVVTFPPDGLYGHPDHMAISRLTTEAVTAAASDQDRHLGRPHSVGALYYMAWTRPALDLFEEAFGKIVMDVDGEMRTPIPWPEGAIDVRLDTSEYWETAWRAIACHRSQLPGYESLLNLPESYHRRLWREQTYIRAARTTAVGAVTNTLFESFPEDTADADERASWVVAPVCPSQPQVAIRRAT